MREFTVIRATLAELELAAQLFNQYRCFYDLADDLPLARGFLEQRLLNNESAVFLVLDADGRALGFMQLYPGFSSLSAKPCWTLNDLFVCDSHRGKGLGKMLLAAARDLGLASGACSLQLETAVDNLRAQGLYQAEGWLRDTEFYRYTLTLQ
ncbi:N-acetyltransferase family protein [Shewanella sp.]|uniref:GNAT family N-acetyltransferase n=1 Tax=Shewanella sp. TaxID=50422 RepID=UPI0035660E1A